MDSRKQRTLALAEPEPYGADRAHPDLLTAEEAARLLRVRREWVYAHARELGGWRLLGDRGPWRFSRRALLAGPPPPPITPPRPGGTRRRQHAAAGASIVLLPRKRRVPSRG